MFPYISISSFARHARLLRLTKTLFGALNTCSAIFLVTSAFGQTQLNLATQSKNADFSTFPFTKTVQVGAGVPATCQIGQLFFQSNVTAGQNLLGCTSANTWSTLGGAGSSYSFLPPLTFNGGTVSISQATNSTNGYLSSSDWNTFNSKQSALTFTGNGTKVATSTGTLLTNHCVKIDLNGNLVDSGAACGAGPLSSTTQLANYLVTQSGGTLIIQAGVQASVFPSGTGTDVGYIYIQGGTLYCADNSVTLAATSCTSATGITSFPAGSTPIAAWNMTGGNFTTPVYDFSQVAPPAHSNSAGTHGQWAIDDSGNIYKCTAANTWVKISGTVSSSF